MGSKSRSSTESVTSYVTESTNTNLQDNEGFAVGAVKAGNDVAFTLTDQGAIARAFSFGERALDTTDETINRALTHAQRAGQDAISFARSAQGDAFDFGEDAFSFARSAQGDAFDLSGDAIDVVERAISRTGQALTDALSFASRAGDNALKFAYDAGRPDAANTRIIIYAAGAVAVVIVMMSVINTRARK